MITQGLHLGDTRELIKKVPNESIDCIVSDIPYRINAGGVRIVPQDDEMGGILNKRDYSKTDPKGCLNRGRRVVSDGTACSDRWVKKNGEVPNAVKNGKMFAHNDIEPKEYLHELYRVLKKGTHCYLMINGRSLANLQKDAEDAGFVFQNLLVWKKQNATPNKFYMQSCEFILMLSKRPARNINNKGDMNIFFDLNEVGKKEHPSQKPIPLFKKMIENSTNKGDIVLDPFAGRGTIIPACIQSERKYLAFEIDEEYYELSKRTEQEALGNVGLFA